ncbi:hypothetical protein SGRIM128S_09041 [Streptomyces griseomycini]
MASHRRPKQPSRARVTVLTTAAAAAVALSSQAANAAPSEKPSKDEVKAKVDKLYEEAEQATEKFNGAKEKQEKLQKEISTVQDNVARGQEELNELRDGLGSLAAAQYRSGAIDSSLQLFLSANPDDYLDKASTVDQLSAQQVDALKKIQEKQRELAQQRSEAFEKLKDLASTRAELGKKKKEVQGKLAAAQKTGGSRRSPRPRRVRREGCRWTGSSSTRTRTQCSARSGRQVVLTHETTHVATRAHTTAATPLWLCEGYADWVGYRGAGRAPGGRARSCRTRCVGGRCPEGLPDDGDFGPPVTRTGWRGPRGRLDGLPDDRGPWGEERLGAFYRAVGAHGKRDGAVGDARAGCWGRRWRNSPRGGGSTYGTGWADSGRPPLGDRQPGAARGPRSQARSASPVARATRSALRRTGLPGCLPARTGTPSR